jgi:hypothetical protein
MKFIEGIIKINKLKKKNNLINKFKLEELFLKKKNFSLKI